MLRIMPVVADRFVADAGNHRVILQHVRGGLWHVRISGAHTLDFRNVYSSPEAAKTDAAWMIEIKFRDWQIPFPEDLQWVEASVWPVRPSGL